MHIFFRPVIAGLFLSAWMQHAGAAPTLSGFSHDDALAYSQAVIGTKPTNIQLQADDGSALTLADYRGKPLVISLIFTSCHHICPSTTQHLAEVVGKARAVLGEDSFNVLTVGFDTANDTPERMAQFRRETGVADSHWQFAAGSAQHMQSLVDQLGFIYAPSSRGFDHLIQASVLDADGAVYRQVYGITFPTPTLVEPLKQLVFGEPREQSTLDYLQNRIRLFCTVYDPATDSYHIDVSVFIGTFVGIVVSIVFGIVLVREWRRSMKAGR
ncbi:MAG: hypothetical protein Hals2KO_17910 [Halioglobus sp.]